jgi:large subunit ribosomal protein L10
LEEISVTLKLEDKKAIVAEVQQVAQVAVSAVAADYRGLTVTQMNELRAKARNSGVYLRVVRNTLARRAVQDTEFACLSDILVGPLVLAFSKEEPGAAARLFRDFAKGKAEQIQVKAIAVGGSLHDPSRLEAVAKLPTRDEAISQLMAMMQAPIAQFVRTVAAPPSAFVRTLAAYRDKKQAEG